MIWDEWEIHVDALLFDESQMNWIESFCRKGSVKQKFHTVLLGHAQDREPILLMTLK